MRILYLILRSLRLPSPPPQTLKLEVEDTGIVEQPSVPDVGEEGGDWMVPLHYQHFRSERIETLLHHVCQLLGFYGGTYQLKYTLGLTQLQLADLFATHSVVG